MLLNGGLESKWIELGMVLSESLYGGFRNISMIENPLVRGLRGVVFFNDLGAVSVFFLEFQTGTEVILQRAPKRAVDLIHQQHQHGVIQPVIAE